MKFTTSENTQWQADKATQIISSGILQNDPEIVNLTIEVIAIAHQTEALRARINDIHHIADQARSEWYREDANERVDEEFYRHDAITQLANALSTLLVYAPQHHRRTDQLG